MRIWGVQSACFRLGFAALIILLLAGGASALSNSGGGSWDYYKEITISNTGSALTDYQVLVNLTSSNFPINAQASGADIRFTNVIGAELSYWIERWDYAGKSAKMWVKVPSIVASGGTTIRMWNGNPSATSASNGTNTFIIFDDFEDASYTDNWVSVTCPGGSGNLSQENGYLRTVGTGAFESRPFARSINQVADKNIKLEFRALKEGITGQVYGIIHWDGIGVNACGSNNSFELYTDDSNDLIYINKFVAGSVHPINLASAAASRDTEWHNYSISYYNNNITVTRDDTISVTGNDTQNFTTTYVGLAGREQAYNSRFDNVRLRKFASPEPSVSVGAEQGGGNSIGYSALVATGQNTFVQSSNGTFGILLKGQTKTINNSVVLNNTGDISARVQARFNDSIAGVFGLISGANVLNASNFALGIPGALVLLNNTGADVQVATAPGVTALDARLSVPSEQVAGDYNGTVILTFSDNV